MVMTISQGVIDNQSGAVLGLGLGLFAWLAATQGGVCGIYAALACLGRRYPHLCIHMCGGDVGPALTDVKTGVVHSVCQNTIRVGVACAMAAASMEWVANHNNHNHGLPHVAERQPSSARALGPAWPLPGLLGRLRMCTSILDEDHDGVNRGA